MVSTHTTRKRLEKQGVGENNNTWGGFLNVNTIDLVDECFGVVCVAATTAGDMVLSTQNGLSDEGRRSVIILTGAPTTVQSTLNVPAVQSFYVVRNKMTGSNKVRIKPAGGVNGVDFSGSGSGAEQGVIISDGTHVREVFRTVSIGAIYTPAQSEVINSLISVATISDVQQGTKTSAGVTPDALATLWQRGADTSVGTQFDIPAGGGTKFNISGTPALASIGTAAGGRDLLMRFTTSRQITHSSKLVLPRSVNITTSVGDWAWFINDAATDATGDNWRLAMYSRINGNPGSLSDFMSTLTATTAGVQAMTNTSAFVTPQSIRYSPTAVKIWVNYDNDGESGTTEGSLNVSSLTDGGVGLATINFTVALASTGYALGTHGSDFLGSSDTGWYSHNIPASGDKLAGSILVVGANGNFGSSGVVDLQQNSVEIFGDL